jgi:hypothetical protein
MRLYTTIKTKEIDLINWDIVRSNREFLRYSVNGTRFLIALEPEHKNYFESFNGMPVMSHAEALQLMLTPEWFIQDTES